ALAARTYQPLNASPPTQLTLSAGTYDYTTSLANLAIRQVMRKSDGGEVFRIPLEELNARYRQDTDVPVDRSAYVIHYALYETNTQLTRLRVGPTPSATATLLLYKD